MKCFNIFSLRLEKQQWKNMIRRITFCLLELQISQQPLICRRRYCIVMRIRDENNNVMNISSLLPSTCHWTWCPGEKISLMIWRVSCSSRSSARPDWRRQWDLSPAAVTWTSRSWRRRRRKTSMRWVVVWARYLSWSNTWWEGSGIIYKTSGRTIVAIWSYQSLGLGCVTPAIVPFTWYTCSLPVRFLYHQTIRNSTYNFNISKQYNRHDLNI